MKSELTLWDFIEKRPDRDWIAHTKNSDSNYTNTYDPSDLYIGNFKVLSDNHDNLINFMMNNKHTCNKKTKPVFPKPSDCDRDITLKVGYNYFNSIEYSWGLLGDSAEKIKEIVGQDFFDKIGMDRDTSLVRLLAFLPGQTNTWHTDNFGPWFDANEHLIPDRENCRCSKGKVVRYLSFISDWHWGHMMQMGTSFFPQWKSGDIFRIPHKVYHVTTNAGLSLKLTLVFTGYIPD
jgi:hypothetical protein